MANSLVLTKLSFVIKNLKNTQLCKSIRQSEVTLVVYSDPIESRHVKTNFS